MHQLARLYKAKNCLLESCFWPKSITEEAVFGIPWWPSIITMLESLEKSQCWADSLYPIDVTVISKLVLKIHVRTGKKLGDDLRWMINYL